MTFPAGVTTVPFNISITDDMILEGIENFMLATDASSLPSNVSVGSLGQATVNIVDNDSKCD